MKSKLEQWRDSGAVIRYHTIRQIKHQTVAEHSHGVACLVMLVSPDCSATLLKAALTHDFHEQHTGDMPSTAKKLYPKLGAAMDIASDTWEIENGLFWNLTQLERRILKFCDYVELLLWSKEEHRMGNRYAEVPLVNICKWLDAMEMPTAEAKELYHVLRTEVAACIGRLEYHYAREEVRT